MRLQPQPYCGGGGWRLPWSFAASYADMQRQVTKGACLKQGGGQGLTAKGVL